MAYLIWVVRIVIFVLLFGLAARNTDMVHVRGYLGYEWQAPLALALLAATLVGVVLGILGAVRTMMYLRQVAPSPTSLPLQQAIETPLESADSAYGPSLKRPPMPYRKAGESLAGDEGA